MGKKMGRHYLNGKGKLPMPRKRRRKTLSKEERLRQKELKFVLLSGVAKYFPTGPYRCEFPPSDQKLLTASFRRRFATMIRKENPYSEIEFQPAVFEIRPSIRTT